MNWFTKDDVSRAADVFLTWFTRVAPDPTSYAGELLTILQGQKDNFVNIVAKVLNLQAEAKAAEGMHAPTPLTFADLQKVLPGISEEDVKDFTDEQCRSLIAVATICKK